MLNTKVAYLWVKQKILSMKNLFSKEICFYKHSNFGRVPYNSISRSIIYFLCWPSLGGLLYISTSVWVYSHFQRFCFKKPKKAKNLQHFSAKNRFFWDCTRKLVDCFIPKNMSFFLYNLLHVGPLWAVSMTCIYTCPSDLFRGILKAPPANPRTYIYR